VVICFSYRCDDLSDFVPHMNSVGCKNPKVNIFYGKALRRGN